MRNTWLKTTVSTSIMISGWSIVHRKPIADRR